MTSHNANFRPDDGTTMCNLDGDDHIDYDDREEEEVAETPEDTQTQNELTQMADDALESSQQHSPMNREPMSHVDLRTVPWGRLIPCGSDTGAAGKDGKMSDGGGPSGVGLDLLPRDPAERKDRGKRSGAGVGTDADDGKGHSFLGLTGLKAPDMFNEYVLGRSTKCDLVSRRCLPKEEKLDGDVGDSKAKKKGENRDGDGGDWVYAMISNRHSRIYCILKTGVGNGVLLEGLDMEVYLEDTSGNGTMVNGTTLLHRGERRLLHTGDEICLINPATLWRRVRTPEERKDIIRRFSYIFINVHQQQGRHAHASTLGSSRFLPGCPNGVITPPLGSGARRSARSAAGAPVGGMVISQAANSKPSAAVDGGGRLPVMVDGRPTPQGLFQSGVETTYRSRPSGPLHQRRSSPRRIEDHYDMRDLLGSGMCGEVRRAINRRTGREMAVKIISTGGRNRSARLLDTDAAIQAEAEMLRQLEHPYIVKLIDVFVTPGVAIYLVMEMLRGGDLFDRIMDKGKYEEVEARRITRRILAAVHYLHEVCNVVHRDLKPENILCMSRTDDVTVKLTDFGLAKSVTTEGLKTFCGTPMYFAPEVLRRRQTVAGRGRYGREADMWSLGVILYILLCGAPPFDADDDSFGFAGGGKDIEFRGERWRDVSEEAKDMVRMLLVVNPSRRMSVTAACEHPWILTEDGDTHGHPLDDPALGEHRRAVFAENAGLEASKISNEGGTDDSIKAMNKENRLRQGELGLPKALAASWPSVTDADATNGAIRDVIYAELAQSVLESVSPAKKQLHFSGQEMRGRDNKEGAGMDMENSISIAKSTDPRENIEGEMNRRCRRGTMMGPKPPPGKVSTMKQGQPTGKADDMPTKTQKVVDGEPASELTDDEITSDFSGEVNEISIQSFSDTTGGEEKMSVGADSSARFSAKGNSTTSSAPACSVADRLKMELGSSVRPTLSSTVVSGSREACVGSRQESPGRKRGRGDNFKSIIVDALGGKRARSGCDGKVQLTLTGKVLPAGTDLRDFVEDEALANRMFIDGEERGPSSVLKGNSSCDRRVQRTLSGGVADVREDISCNDDALFPPAHKRKDCLVSTPTVGDDKLSGVETGQCTSSITEGRQMTLSNWFKTKK